MIINHEMAPFLRLIDQLIVGYYPLLSSAINQPINQLMILNQLINQ